MVTYYRNRKGFAYRSVRTGKKRYSKGRFPYLHVRRPTYHVPLNKTRGKVPFPKVHYCKLHLTYQGSISSTTGSFGSFSNPFRLNDGSDPSGALTAQQARWWDQLATIYDKYAIYGCKVTAVFTNAEKIGEVGISAYDGTAPASFLELNERENCMARVIDANTGSKTQVVLARYFSFPKIVGIPKNQYLNEDDYFVGVASAPGNIVYGQCFYQAYGAQTSSVSVKLSLTFYCKFAGIADPADS